jgi:hypothetical protein
MAGGLLGLIFDQIQRGKENRRAEENASTQRMYAENQNAREGAREYREQKEFDEKLKEEEEKKKERMKAQLPSLWAAARNYGPELATAMAPQGVSFSQPSLNTLHGVEEGPEANPAASAARYLMGPQGNIDQTPVQMSQAQAAGMPEYPGMDFEAPPEPRHLPVPQPDMRGKLMMQIKGVKGLPDITSEVPEHMGGTTGLGPDADQMLQEMLMSNPTMKPKDAMALVYRMVGGREAETGRASRAENVIDERAKELTDRLGNDEKYKLSVQQKLDEAEKNRENARKVAALRAAAGGNTTPTPTAVADLVGMKEEGASGQEIAAAAAKAKIPEKQWVGPVSAVPREAAAATRATERRESMRITDENGNDIGVAHSTQIASTLNKQNAAYAQFRNRMQALIEDIKTTGPRALSVDEWQRRASLAAAAAAAGRVYNGLGATDASQRLEQQINGAMGVPGHGWLMGANLGVVEHVLDEANAQHTARNNIALRKGGGPELPPALGGPKAKKKTNLDALEEWANGLGK